MFVHLDSLARDMPRLVVATMGGEHFGGVMTDHQAIMFLLAEVARLEERIKALESTKES